MTHDMIMKVSAGLKTHYIFKNGSNSRILSEPFQR